MGGNALRSVGLTPKRISTEEQKKLIKRFEEKTQGLFLEIHPVLCLKDKPTHGDTDIAVLIPQKTAHDTPRILQETLQPKALLKNNNILSLEFEGTQVDLALHTERTKLESYLHFCHYSPLGNILSRMLKTTGCTFGLQGLTYPIRNSDSPDSPTLKSLLLSQSMPQILTLAGLNPTVWEKGFASATALYTYLSQSPLLDPNTFLPENLNHKNRQRMAKRPDFQHWLDYLQKDPPQNREKKTPSEWREILKENFPHIDIAAEQKKVLTEHSRHKERRGKFGGRLLLELGVSPSQIGTTLKTLQKTLEKTTPLTTWIDSHSQEEIKKAIKKMLLDLHKDNPDLA